jgi:hypothetical protein
VLGAPAKLYKESEKYHFSVNMRCLGATNAMAGSHDIEVPCKRSRVTLGGWRVIGVAGVLALWRC